jgi:ADP-ribosylglycohydrolase
MRTINLDAVKGVLFGVAIGDALGVPVEFEGHEKRKADPVTDMRSEGTFGMPAGTFSDDASLAFCLAEALASETSLEGIIRQTAENMVRWARDGWWSPDNDAFDIGRTTWEAIGKLDVYLRQGAYGKLTQAGPSDDDSNGNGSLMRVAPLACYLRDKPIAERFDITRKISSLTHGHIRACIACFYYLEYMLRLLAGQDRMAAYQELKREIYGFLREQGVPQAELSPFARLLAGDIYTLPEKEIRSGGYVIETIEAALWSFLTTTNYRAAVLKAVNLGHDTDTTAAVTGGLAGLYYGYTGIPAEWTAAIRMAAEIEDLSKRLYQRLSGEEQV